MSYVGKMKEGERIASIYLIASASRGVTVNGAPYLNVTLQDKTGTIEGRKWDADEADIEAIQTGNFCFIRGDVIRHKNQIQVKISECRKIDEQQEMLDLDEYLIQGPVDIDQLKTEVTRLLASLSDREFALVANSFWGRYQEELTYAAAAVKIHHAYRGGLLHHLVSMMRLGEAVAASYPFLDRDLLLVGIFLHDLGKLKELTGLVNVSYSLRGRLVGHISIIHEEVCAVCRECNIDQEKAILLEHMVLAHHGRLEHGSPVLPQIPEALCLYLVDNLDASMNSFERALEAIGEGEFTSRLPAFDDRNIYKRKK